MKRGIVSKSEVIQVPNYEFIKNIEEGEGYKYLCILEADRFKNWKGRKMRENNIFVGYRKF